MKLNPGTDEERLAYCARRIKTLEDRLAALQTRRLL
jgi:hypothetical protein